MILARHRGAAAGDPGGDDFARRSLSFLRESVIRCQAEGYLAGLDPALTAFTFWAAVHGAISLALRQRVPFDEIDAGAIADGAVETMMHLVTTTRRVDHPVHPTETASLSRE